MNQNQTMTTTESITSAARDAGQITRFILAEIGLSGRRTKKNIAGLTESEIAALPPGTVTTLAYGGASVMHDMTMPVADAIAAGYTLDDVRRAVRETETTTGNAPSILVKRHRKLTEAELAKARKGYVSEAVADEYAHPDKVWSCDVDLAEIEPTDTITIHYPYVG